MSTLAAAPDPQPTGKTSRTGFRGKHVFAIAGGVAALFAMCIVLLAWYANSSQFQDRVRRKVIATIEQATGGRVELKSFRWRLIHLELEADDLTVHGLEVPGELPYAHVDKLKIRARILAFLQPKIGLNLVVAEHPVFHLILYPDGSTNQPKPKVSGGGRSTQDTLFDLAVDRLEVADGLAIVNERRIPFDLSARSLGATVTYAPAANGKDRYLANVTVADLTAHRGKEPPVRSTIDFSADLGRNFVQLKSLHLKTGPSLLEASGAIDDLGTGQWHVAVTGRIDVREVEALTEVEGLRGGIADLHLSGHGRGYEKFLIEGDASLHDGIYKSSYVTLQGVNGMTKIHATEEALDVADSVVRLNHGGVIQGNLQLTHWLPPVLPPPPSGIESSPTANKRVIAAPSPKPQQTRGTVRARVLGVTLQSVLNATAARRYQDLGFDTAATGPVDVDWVGGADDLTVTAKLTMAPSPGGLNGQVPLSGALDAEYFNRTGTVKILTLEAHTPGTKLSVKGALGVYPESRTSALEGDLITNNLAEFDRTLSAMGLAINGKKGARALPIELQGQAEFHGQVTGTIFEPIVNGHVIATNFETIVPASGSVKLPIETDAGKPSSVAARPLAAVAGERKINWDRLDATGEYSLEKISIQQATITRGPTVVHASGNIRPHRINLHRADFDEQSAIDATVGVQDADVSDVLAMVGQPQVRATGKLSLDAHAGGTLNNLHGGGHLSAKEGEIYDEPYRSLTADLGLVGRELAITKLTFSQNGGQILADAAYDLESKTLRANAAGRGFELSHLLHVQRQNLGLTGRLEFEAHGSGTIESPTIHANAHLVEVVLSGQKLGNVDADAHSEHGALFYTAESHPAGAELHISGQTELRGEYVTQARLTFTALDIDPFLRLAKIQGLTAHSSIAGQVSVGGPLKEPKRLNGEASVSQFAVALAGVPLQSEGPVHAVLKNGVLTLDPLHITGEDTNLRAQGTVSVLAKGELKLHAEGAVNLKLAQTVNPDISSSGRVDFTVDARGMIERPDLSGQVRFLNGAVSLEDVPNGLSQINGTLEFNQDRLDVQSLTAQTGGGQLKIGGYITYLHGLYGDLTASGKNIRMRYPTGVSSVSDATLRLQGAQKNLLLSGNILVTRFALNPNLDISGLVGSAASVPPPLDPDAPSNHVRLDIHITSAPALNFQNSFAKLAGDVDLRLRGTVASPSILGRVNVTEGSANFAGTQYQLQHGDIFFTNPVRIDPTIDLDATARVENYDITIGLHGTANKLNVSYRSEPPLAQSDVIALLALGRTQEEQSMVTQQQQNVGTNSTTNALLGGALNATVSNRVQKLFGVGSVKIDPTFVGSLGNSTARVTVEQQVSGNVTLTYATNVNSSAQQLIQAQIGVTQNVSLVAVRDENGVFSMVIKVHRRYR